MIVSVCTLIVFGYQTVLTRQHALLSVYPHLHITNGKSGTTQYQYLLKNDGIGPAKITEISVVLLDGTEYPSLREYVEDKIENGDGILYFNSDIYVGQLIPKDDVIPLFGLTDELLAAEYGLPPNNRESAQMLRRVLNSDSLIFEITYESVFGESWKISRESSAPVKLD